ncbi:MAG: hypothetical protein AAFN77_23805 [Planctomycetota bacterium]
MDQLAPTIDWIKKNIFWLTCGILFIATIASWFVSTGSLAKEQKDNESKVKSNIAMAEGIQRKTPTDLPDLVGAHPNTKTQEGMEEELEETLEAIVEAWKLRVKAQEDLLVWPSVIDNDEFKKVFGEFNPAETFPAKWDTRVDQLLILYRRRIGDHMIKLCGDELLRTNWKYDPANFPEIEDPVDNEEEDPEGGQSGGFGGFGAGGRGPGAGFDDPEDGLAMQDDLNRFAVIWSDVNQDLWYQKMTMFQGIDDHGGESINPTPLQCYMLQQDIWLLEAMFHVIRDINGNSNANDLSVIKQIDHIAFGREAVKQLGELTAPDPRLAPSANPDEDAMAPGGRSDPMLGGADDRDYGSDDPGDGRGGGSGFGSYNVAAIGLPPFHRRYVDLNLNPITSKKVLEVIRAKELPTDNLELIIAKRVPVRIALKMDERRISDFMAACANSPFAFEIQQVRINKHEPGGEEIPLGGFGEGEENKLGGMGTTIGDNESTLSMDQLAQPIEVRTNYDVNVEFFGIVKIYNPVREDFLRQAAGLTPEDGGAPGDPNESASNVGPANRNSSNSKF